MEAIRQMKEGKKVNRKGVGGYLELEQHKEVIVMEDGDPIAPSLVEWFEATDWEIYEEEDNWIPTFYDIGVCPRYSDEQRVLPINQFKTFIQKVKEDFDGCFPQSEMVVDDKLATMKITINKIIDKRAGRL